MVAFSHVKHSVMDHGEGGNKKFNNQNSQLEKHFFRPEPRQPEIQTHEHYRGQGAIEG